MAAGCLCPVCGYPDLEEPAYMHGEASFTICPSCGVEFGYDDATTSHADLRHRWIEAGANWASTVDTPPPGWDARQQLKKAGLAQP